MSLPAPLAGLLAALFLVAAVLCTSSLWRRRARHEGPAAAAEGNHVLMGVGMALMVLPATVRAVPPVAGVVAFALIGLGWAVRLVALRAQGRTLGSPIGGDRCAAHPTHLLLSNAAMVVMYAVTLPSGPVAAASGAHAGHGGGSSPLALSAVAVTLALYLLVHAAVTVAALARATAPVAVTVGGGGPAGAAGRFVDAPAVQLGCQAVTGAGTALMLLVH